MKKIMLMSVIITLLSVAAISSHLAMARGGYGGHSHGGTSLDVYIGGGYGYYGGFGPGYYGGFGPGYYGYGDPFFYSPFNAFPPAYAYPPVVVAPSTPPVYVEQESVALPEQPQANYWYYCRDAEGYYPYIKQCPSGWLKVVPQPRQ